MVGVGRISGMTVTQSLHAKVPNAVPLHGLSAVVKNPASHWPQLRRTDILRKLSQFFKVKSLAPKALRNSMMYLRT